MPYKLIIKEEALNDAIEAFLYYADKSEGLGDRFLRCLDRCYYLISHNPMHYSFVHSDKERTLRDVKVKDFPYLVIYDFVNSEVVVYAVHNCYKKPNP